MDHVLVAVPEHAHDWYFPSLRDHVVRRLAEREVTARPFRHPIGAAGSRALTDRLDAELADADCVGAVVIGFRIGAPAAALLARHARPVVVIGGPCPGTSSVSIDDAAVARAATQHLLDLGHVAIAHLGGYALSADDFAMRSDRVRGYSEAMQQAGLGESSHVVPCDFTPGAAGRAARDLLAGADRPTAVFAVADRMAFEVLDTARAMGLRVPQDLSVVGIDDHPEAADRGLTTLRQDLPSMGATAADLVMTGGPSRDVVFEPRLIERRTTAALAPYVDRPRGLRGLFRRRD